MSNYKTIRSKAYNEKKREKGSKTIYSIFCRSFSTYLTFILYKLKVRPNTISILSIFSGLIGIGYIYNGIFTFGSIFVALSKYLDCVDGELARVSGIFSKKANWLEPINSDIQYLFVLPSLSVALFNRGLINIDLVFLSFIACGFYVLIRKYWNAHVPQNNNIPFVKKILYCQFKPSIKLRSKSKLGAYLFYLKYNILTQNGVLYPVLIFIAFWDINFLVYYLLFFIYTYTSFATLTIIGMLLLPLDRYKSKSI